eukprot:2033291-Rhodomonas_salina.2
MQFYAGTSDIFTTGGGASRACTQVECSITVTAVTTQNEICDPLRWSTGLRTSIRVALSSD